MDKIIIVPNMSVQRFHYSCMLLKYIEHLFTVTVPTPYHYPQSSSPIYHLQILMSVVMEYTVVSKYATIHKGHTAACAVMAINSIMITTPAEVRLQ